MKTLILILTAFGAIYMGACTYSFDGDYYVEPVADEPTTLHASTNLDTMDLIDPSDSLEVTYSVGIENGALYYVAAAIEDLIFYDSIFPVDRDTLTGPYTIEDSFIIPEDLPVDSGEYQLDIVFLYSSNTNSLADYYKYEYNERMLSYMIYLNGGGQ